jgi:hypothetical protein
MNYLEIVKEKFNNCKVELTLMEFQNIIDSINIPKLLKCIESNLDSIIIKESFLHANGFNKLVLFILNNGSRLRLHIWESPEKMRQNDLHNHCSSMISFIIRGCLLNYTFTTEKHENAKDYYKFEDKRIGTDHSMEFENIVNISGNTKKILKTKDIYYLDPYEIHTSTPLEEYTVTLVYQSGKWIKNSEVFKLEKKHIINVKGIFDKTKIEKILKKVNNKLAYDF